MALRVENARIPAEIAVFFGSLFIVGSVFYTGLKVYDYKATKTQTQELFAAINGYIVYSLKYGYPVLIGIWVRFRFKLRETGTRKLEPLSMGPFITYLVHKIQKITVFQYPNSIS